MSILEGKTIFVTGAGGFLGKHVCKRLAEQGALVVKNKIDLVNPEDCVLPEDIDLIVHLAAAVSGIGPNRVFPSFFLEANTAMALNILGLSHRAGDIPIVAAGSVCAYPEDAPIPFNETDFWKGKPDSNNLGYGIAKRFLAGALECAYNQYGLRYVHLISGNLYGPGDHFSADGHVIPSLIKRFYRARQDNEPSVEIWGSGNATRDFLYVEDAARAYANACEWLSTAVGSLECNIGSGVEVAICQIARIIADEIGYTGALAYNTDKPDGQMRRKIDTNKADVLLDWANSTSLQRGINRTVRWYAEEMPQ